MALNPSPKESLDAIFERLTSVYHTISLGPNSDPKAKAQLRKAAMELIAATQEPHEAIMAFTTSNAVFACYRVAADCGVFTSMPKEGRISARELAGKTGADERLIGGLIF
jgi:hypothetical protein